MKSLPKNTPALRETDLVRMIDNDEHFRVSVIQETLFTMKYRVYIDVGVKRYELYNQRANARSFSSLDTFYKFCQRIGINEALIQVTHTKDGVIPK